MRKTWCGIRFYMEAKYGKLFNNKEWKLIKESLNPIANSNQIRRMSISDLKETIDKILG